MQGTKYETRNSKKKIIVAPKSMIFFVDPRVLVDEWPDSKYGDSLINFWQKIRRWIFVLRKGSRKGEIET